jgi:hypothetical protein
MSAAKILKICIYETLLASIIGCRRFPEQFYVIGRS